MVFLIFCWSVFVLVGYRIGVWEFEEVRLRFCSGFVLVGYREGIEYSGNRFFRVLL